MNYKVYQDYLLNNPDEYDWYMNSKQTSPIELQEMFVFRVMQVYNDTSLYDEWYSYVKLRKDKYLANERWNEQLRYWQLEPKMFNYFLKGFERTIEGWEDYYTSKLEELRALNNC